MKKLLFILPLALLCGCKSEQMLNNTTGDGMNINLLVPIPGTTSSLLSIQLQGGIYKNTALIQPTATNKVYTASVAINSKTKQSDSIVGNVNPTTGTNAVASATVVAGAFDVNTVLIGGGTIDDSTNNLNSTVSQ